MWKNIKLRLEVLIDHFILLDVTPPTVQNCPSNITDRSNSLQKDITWTAPTFTDNVAVVSVLSNREPGFTMDTYTSLTVRYTASDAAGNIVYCSFIITLEGIAAIMGFTLPCHFYSSRQTSLFKASLNLSYSGFNPLRPWVKIINLREKSLSAIHGISLCPVDNTIVFL